MQSVASTSEGELFSKIISQASIPDAIKARDRNGILAYINRHNTTFTQALYTLYSSKGKVIKTRDYESGQLEDIKRKYAVTVASVAGDNHTTFGIANIDRALLQANDVLFVHKLYAAARYDPLVYGQVDSSGTSYEPKTSIDIGARPVEIHYSTSQGVDGTYPEVRYRDYEQVKVLSVGDFNSHGAGNVKVTVQRFYSAPHARDLGGMFVHSNYQSLINAGVAANSNRGAITTSMYVFRGENSFPEGSGNPIGFSKNPERLIDFTQESKYAIDWTEESVGHAQYYDMSQLTIAEKLLMTKMAKDKEYQSLYGRKGRVNRALTNAEEMTAGGLMEFIPTDAAHNHTLDGSTMNYNNFLDFTTKIADLGGSTEWMMWCGKEAYNAFVKAFYNEDRLRFSKEESQRFQMSVEQIIGSGITINIMQNQGMSETGRGNECILLDKNYPVMEPLVYNDWDMKIKQDATDGTTTMKKKVYMSITGWARRFPHYTSHLVLTNI